MGETKPAQLSACQLGPVLRFPHYWHVWPIDNRYATYTMADMDALLNKAKSYTNVQISDALTMLGQKATTTEAEEIALGVLVGVYIERMINIGIHPSKAEAMANALLGQ